MEKERELVIIAVAPSFMQMTYACITSRPIDGGVDDLVMKPCI